MRKLITLSHLKGQITAPVSKSDAQRKIIIAALAKGTSRLKNFRFNNDIKYALRLAFSLNAEIKFENKDLIIRGNPKLKNTKIFCGESGFVARVAMGLSFFFEEDIYIYGTGSLLRRNFSKEFENLNRNGKEIDSNGKLPVFIRHKSLKNKYSLNCDSGSQFLSGVLIGAGFADYDIEIKAYNPVSRPYIDLTLSVMQKFGIKTIVSRKNMFKITGKDKYRPITGIAEGDWSSGAFLLTASALSGDIILSGLNLKSKQADIKILEVLKLAGVNFDVYNNSVLCRKTKPKAFIFNASECPDLIPPLVALAVGANGKSVIKGAERLLNKESSRGEILQQEMTKLGIKINLQDDEITVFGSEVKGGTVNSHNDHRIAMALTVVGMMSKQQIIIENAETVGKSYPDFFKDLVKIGGNIK